MLFTTTYTTTIHLLQLHFQEPWSINHNYELQICFNAALSAKFLCAHEKLRTHSYWEYKIQLFVY